MFCTITSIIYEFITYFSFLMVVPEEFFGSSIVLVAAVGSEGGSASYLVLSSCAVMVNHCLLCVT